MMEFDKDIFRELCKADGYTQNERSGIGTYKEKRLHRIIKHLVCDDETYHETDVGNYIADVCKDKVITEIQTSNFRALVPKLRYYLENTDYEIRIIHPVIANKTLYRICPESGEILRKKLSPTHGSYISALPDLYCIREFVNDPRISITVMLINADEYRYSERVRFRKSGAYDSELFPTELADFTEYKTADDFRVFLPDTHGQFSASDFSKITKLKGRDVYSALNFLSYIGLLERTEVGRKYFYRLKKS